MKKKLLFGLILTITTGLLAFGQTKIYNGNFNSSNFQGNAEYHYTEQPDNRIFSGPFTFKTGNNSVSITGNYLNDLKNGTWKFMLTNVANTDIILKYLVSANVSGSFKNGNIDGNWNLTRTKIISFSNNEISNYYQNSLNSLSYLFDGNNIDFNKSTTVIEKSTANFNDNHFVGSFSYSINGGKSLVNGQFNDQGYFDGAWTVNYYQDRILHLQTRTYLNGVLLTIKNKDNSTGEVTTVYDKTIEVIEFFQNYNPSENSSKIGDIYYTISEGKTTESKITFLEDAISIWYNNTSLSKSAYIFEIERGSNKLAKYPERIITIDYEKTEEAKNEKERIAEEQRELEEAKKKEERELEYERQRKVAQEQKELEEAKKKKEREIEYEKQRILREFQNSDYGILQQRIKDEFNEWLIKTDYESSTDYNNRVKKQSDQKFKSIVSEKIIESKNNYISISARLGKYDPENETFTIFANNDTLYVKIPKGIAPTVSDYIINKQKNNTTNSIRIFPKNMVMRNNKWTITEALIIFKVGGSDGSCVHNHSSYQLILAESKKNLYGKCDGSGYGEFEIKDISKFTDNLPNGVYFSKWNNLNNFPVQSLDFTFEALGIELPIK